MFFKLDLTVVFKFLFLNPNTPCSKKIIIRSKSAVLLRTNLYLKPNLIRDAFERALAALEACKHTRGMIIVAAAYGKSSFYSQELAC